jgi:GTPase SAR1 family protein
MGLSCTKPSPEVQESRRIDKYLKTAGSEYRQEVKLLLLGAGESGKSTIAKQMQILHKNGFSDQERAAFIPTITFNILNSLNVLIRNRDTTRFALSPVVQKLADGFIAKFPEQDIPSVGSISKDDAQVIQLLWNDPAIKAAYLQDAAKLQLCSSAQYFLDALERVVQSDYIPSDQDILHARRATTGIQTISFTVEDVPFKCVDVGGQRSERRKWLHVFDDVSAVLFCVALDEYNMRLLEDVNVWRMHESLKLFGEIVNSSHLSKSGMILFLNKKDLFAQKIKQVDLLDVFPNYKGGKNYEPAINYIQDQFIQEAKEPGRVYVHVTVATDTENISFVFNAVKDLLLNQMLAISGV